MSTRAPFRFVAACVCALTLVSCDAPALPRTPQTAVRKPALTRQWTWFVKVKNSTERYVWVTRYWSRKGLATWHIEGANCVKPGDVLNGRIDWKWEGQNGEGKLRFQVIRSNTNCSGSTADNVWGPKCSFLWNRRDEAYGEAIFKFDKGYRLNMTCWGSSH